MESIPNHCYRSEQSVYHWLDSYHYEHQLFASFLISEITINLERPFKPLLTNDHHWVYTKNTVNAKVHNQETKKIGSFLFC